MIVPPAPKKKFKNPLIFIVGTFFLFLYIFFSLWFLYTPFKQRILREYYARRYPNIPKLEFIPKIRHDSYLSNSRYFTVKGLTTVVIYPDNSQRSYTHGEVTNLPKELWTDELGASYAASIKSKDIAVDIINRMVAVSENKIVKIISLPSDTIVRKRIWKLDKGVPSESLRSYPSSLSEIEVGDYVIFQENQENSIYMLTVIKRENK